MTHFDERSGIVPCVTPWGKWWQTCEEICMLINVEEGTSTKEIKCTFKPRHVKIIVGGKTIVEVCTEFVGLRLGAPHLSD